MDSSTLQDLLEMKAQTLAPRRVVLCGSTRFSEAFQQMNQAETIAGRIVLSIGCDTHSDDQLSLSADKLTLDLLHLWKIDLADEVIILNVEGYIGLSTAREIEYALMLGKPVRFLESCPLALRRGLQWMRVTDTYVGKASRGDLIAVAGELLREMVAQWRATGDGNYVNFVYDPDSWVPLALVERVRDAWFLDYATTHQWWSDHLAG